MICSEQILSPPPGGFKLARLSSEAKDLMKRVDTGQNIYPTTLQLNPYIVHEPKKFIHHFEDKTTQTEKASGAQAHKILSGDPKPSMTTLNSKMVRLKFRKNH